MKSLRHLTSGMTLIETLVVMGLSTFVFGLILNTLIVTQRESDQLCAAEQMHQEALLISQTIERALRYRVAPEELEGVMAGGAGPEEASGGSGTTSSLPASIAGISSSTLLATTTTKAAVHETSSTTDKQTTAVEELPADRFPASHRSDFTSVPASIQNILGTTTTMQNAPAGPVAANAAQSPVIAPAQATPVPPVPTRQSRNASGQERFTTDEIIVYSLGAGPNRSRLVTALRNSRGLGQTPSHAYLEQSPAGSAFAPGARRRSLGPNSDKYQSQISFRFANSFNGMNATWVRDSREVPKLVEYTVRIWPIGASDSDDDQDLPSRSKVYQLTSAVAL